jgi:pimeloyl-ACP methyl ester carboxylesterase
MGGMTIMSLAQRHPELFGERVVGVALVATSPGKLAEVTFGLPSAFLPVSRRVTPFLTRGMRGRPELFERGRRIGTDLAFLATRRGSFGNKSVSPSLVELTEQMIAQTPVDVIAEFYDTFKDHDVLHALPVLAAVETLVLVGSEDLLTPVGHSREIASVLPNAQLVVLEGAGHMVQLERHALVTLQLRALVRRATGSRRRTA